MGASTPWKKKLDPKVEKLLRLIVEARRVRMGAVSTRSAKS
jgi:hypothetical protein